MKDYKTFFETLKQYTGGAKDVYIFGSCIVNHFMLGIHHPLTSDYDLLITDVNSFKSITQCEDEEISSSFIRKKMRLNGINLDIIYLKLKEGHEVEHIIGSSVYLYQCAYYDLFNDELVLMNHKSFDKWVEEYTNMTMNPNVGEHFFQNYDRWLKNKNKA